MQGEASAVTGGEAWSAKPFWDLPQNVPLIDELSMNRTKIHSGCSISRRKELIARNEELVAQILGPDPSRKEMDQLRSIVRHMKPTRDTFDHLYGSEVSEDMCKERLDASVSAANLVQPEDEPVFH